MAVGSHDGTYQGKRYFQASAMYHGAFAKYGDILYVKGRKDFAYRYVMLMGHNIDGVVAIMS